MTRAGGSLIALAAVLVAAIAGGLAQQSPGEYGGLDGDQTVRYIAWAALAGAAYALGIVLVRRRRSPADMPTVLVAGLVCRLMVLVAPPVHSTDLYRYVWDGRVQAAGVNPYLYLPSDPALRSLRDTGTGAAAIYPNINRFDSAPTIYPPAAQALFAAIGLTVSSIWTVKAAMLAFDVATTALALLLLRAAGRPAAQVLIWAWNPLVIWEFAGGGHIDAMAIAFIALALLLAARARIGWAALALSAAVLTKLLPAALFPALWRRWDLRTPLIAAGAVAAGYAAYAGAGWRVFGYLGGYAQEEQLDSGGGFLVLRLARLAGPLPQWAGAAYAGAALTLLAVTAVLVVRRPLPTLPPARAIAVAHAALVLAGALTAVMSPHYPWYLAILVLPAVIVPSWSAIWPTLAGPLLYLDPDRMFVVWPALVYLPSLALLLLEIVPRPARVRPALLEGP